MTRSVIILMNRLALAGAVFFSTVSGCNFGRHLVRAGETVEMYVPDTWRFSQASSDDGLGTNLWLFNGEHGAAVRVIVVPSTKLTPAAVAAMVLPELDRCRYRFSAADLPAEDTGQDVVLEYRDPQGDESGRLIVKRLRSERNLIVIFAGVWLPRADASAARELTEIADSARPVRP